MFDNFDTIRMARNMGAHAMMRQSLVAQNVANADTPGYQARDLGKFTDTAGSGFDLAMRATDARHFSGGAMAAAPILTETGGRSPNGNTVSLEDEMMRAADISREHNLSLTVYKSALGLLRAGLGRR
ncbi:FlgB family protein [Paracoccus pacificus]|uniref:FlgB family protein n=1 Tax=Paracoccus pacificus TaxID=1463598 RepID=A0ABW4R8M2_9RHOB